MDTGSAEDIGGLFIPISGDYSQLKSDFETAQQLGQAAGKDIAQAFTGAAEGEEALEAAWQRLIGVGYSATEALQIFKDAASQLTTAEQAAGQQLELFSGALDGVPWADANGQLNLFTDELEPLKSNADAAAVATAGLADAEKNAGDGAAVATHETAGLAEQLTALASALAITEGLKEFGSEALKVASEQQVLVISLTALGGSAAGAQKQLEEIDRFSFSNALEIDKVEAATQKLSAYGIQASQIPRLLQAAADSAAATGNSFDGVAEKISNMALSGMAGARQLTTLGISSADLAKQIGVDVSKVAAAFKGLDDGARVDALVGALGKFEGTSAAVANSVAGQWQNFQNDMHNIFEAVGTAVLPVASQILELFRDTLMPAIKGAIQVFMDLPEPVRNFAVGLGVLAAAAVPVVAGIAAFAVGMAGLQSILPIVTGLAETFGVTITASASAIAGATLLYGGLAIAIMQGYNAWKGWKDAEAGLAQATKEADDKLAELEIMLIRQGVNITELKEKYHSGQISMEDYNRGLRDQLLAFQAAHPVVQQHVEVMGKAHDAVSLYAVSLQAAKDNLAKVTAEYDTGKATAAQLLTAQQQLTSAQNSYSDALGRAYQNHTTAKTALREFIPPLNEAATAEQIAAAATDAHKIKTDQLILALGGAGQRLVEAKYNFDQATVSGNGLQEATARLVKASAEYEKAQNALNVSVADFQKLADNPPKLAPIFDATAMSIKGALNEIAKFVPAIEPIAKPVQSLSDDFRALGLKVDDVTGDVNNKLLAAFDDLGNHSEITLTGVELAWSKVSGAVQHLAQVDMPAALAEQQKYIDLLVKTGAAEYQVQQAVAQKLAMEIKYASQSGTDATAQIIALANINEKQQANYDSTHRWGEMYVNVLGDIHSGFENLGKALADNLVDAKSWHDVWQGFLKSIEKEVLEQVIGVAFKALGNQVAGLLSSIIPGATTVAQAGAGIVSVTTQAGGAIADAAAKSAGSIASTATTATTSVAQTAGSAVSAVGSTVMSTIGAIGSAVGALASIGQFIQGFQAEATANAIEHNTRYLQIQFEQTQQAIFWPMKVNSDYMLGTMGDISNHTAGILATVQGWLPFLGDIISWLGVIDADVGGAGSLGAPGGAPAAAETPAPGAGQDIAVPPGELMQVEPPPDLQKTAEDMQQQYVDALRKAAEQAEANAKANATSVQALVDAAAATYKLAAASGQAADKAHADELQQAAGALQLQQAQQQLQTATNGLTTATTGATTGLLNAGQVTLQSAGSLDLAATHLDAAATALLAAAQLFTGSTTGTPGPAPGAGGHPVSELLYGEDLQRAAYESLTATIQANGGQVPGSFDALLPWNIGTAANSSQVPATTGGSTLLFDFSGADFGGADPVTMQRQIMDSVTRALRTAGANF